jgi:hypothetical protein
MSNPTSHLGWRTTALQHLQQFTLVKGTLFHICKVITDTISNIVLEETLITDFKTFKAEALFTKQGIHKVTATVSPIMVTHSPIGSVIILQSEFE